MNNSKYKNFLGGGGGGGGWACPQKCLNFRPFEIASGAFSDHLWFSNDMMR